MNQMSASEEVVDYVARAAVLSITSGEYNVSKDCSTLMEGETLDAVTSCRVISNGNGVVVTLKGLSNNLNRELNALSSPPALTIRDGVFTFKP